MSKAISAVGRQYADNGCHNEDRYGAYLSGFSFETQLRDDGGCEELCPNVSNEVAIQIMAYTEVAYPVFTIPKYMRVPQ